MQKHPKTKRLDLRLSEKTDGQLIELQRILTSELGTPISRTKAIEIAISKLLDHFTSNPKQHRLI